MNLAGRGPVRIEAPAFGKHVMAARAGKTDIVLWL